MLQLQLMCRKKGNIAVQVVTIINPADVPVFKDQTHNWVSWCIHWWAGWVGDFTRCLTMLSHLMSSSYLKAAPRPDLLVSTRLTWLECHGGARGGGSVLVVIETAWIYDSSLTRVVRIYMLHMKNKNTSLWYATTCPSPFLFIVLTWNSHREKGIHIPQLPSRCLFQFQTQTSPLWIKAINNLHCSLITPTAFLCFPQKEKRRKRKLHCSRGFFHHPSPS